MTGIEAIKQQKKQERLGQKPPFRYNDFTKQKEYLELWETGACCEICRNHSSICEGIPNPCMLYMQ